MLTSLILRCGIRNDSFSSFISKFPPMDMYFFSDHKNKMWGRKLSCTLVSFLFCFLSFLGYLLAWAGWLCLPRSHPRCGQPGILLLAGNRGSQRITTQTLHISDPSPRHSLLCEFLNVLIFLAGTASWAQEAPRVFHPVCEAAEACPAGILRWPPADCKGSSLHLCF